MSKLKLLNVLLAGGACVTALATAASAENFAIPAGDLNTALSTYSATTGVQLIVSADAVRGVRTRGVTGELPANAALTRILMGTGFVAHRNGSAAVIMPRQDMPQTKLIEATPVRMAASSAAAGIESVIVTSSKIKGDIQTVPIAITALSQEQLTQRQIAGGPDLVKEVPNLTFSKTNFTGYNLQIRGIGTQAISVTIDPAVAVAFNDTPFLRNHFFEQEFYDLSQVEVLRGPQGTLYGRNANAGVVNIVSAKPTDQFEAALSADWGNFSNRRYEGMINIPIMDDRLALRVAGEWTKRDGYAFNEVKNQLTDGRDLWSSRASLRWRPFDNVTTDLIWEHFQESDDRLRSGKQLCKTDPGPSSFVAADGTVVNVPAPQETVYNVSSANFSQGCLPNGLYDNESFQVPNGFSMPLVTGAAFEGFLVSGKNPYASLVQSHNLRNIQSEIDPHYRANNDTLEFNAEWNIAPTLTFNSETGYNRDFLWSTEDFNRFDTAPGVFVYQGAGNSQTVRLGLQPTGDYACFDGYYSVGSNQCAAGGHGGSTATAIFCDPQLGCSDRLVVQDLATERAWQLNQEFRLNSNFQGPFNFSAGGNFLHYETDEKYYVFSNVLTMLGLNQATCIGIDPHDDIFCPVNGKSYPNGLSACTPTQCPQYVDPNPITNPDDNGHNYFLSRNPYVLNSYAMFGEAYYSITENLKLTGGLRWTDDEKHFVEYPSRLITPAYGIPRTGTVDQSWKKFSGRAVINWTPKLDFTDQTMVYGSYSHGYKAGGANPPPAVFDSNQGASFPIHPLTFEPEYIDAFELGTKNTALDGALVFNADVFYYDYKGYQISQIVDRTSVNINVDATVRGAEIQTSWSPLQGFKLGFNGGYEDTQIKDNQFFIDLMDRTYGHHDTWTIMKPWAGEASNCIFPTYVAAALVQSYAGMGQGNPVTQSCGYAYNRGVDPVTGRNYVAETGNGTHTPTGPYGSPHHAPPASYPGFDPLSIDPDLNPALLSTVNNGLGLPPNNGQGFEKPIGGNELPNAPHFTLSLTGDYTMPVSENWAATLHSDFYWQSQSFARIFNDRPYDKIRGYSNVNLALILTDVTGWQVMGYVKNIFDTTAITGDFLNSDDTGLTTNIFVTDPRLYGIRVTKQFTGDSDGGGFDWFSNADGSRPSLWLTVGGNFNAQLNAGQQQFEPDFMALAVPGLPDPAAIAKAPKSGIDWEGKLTYQPEDSDWVLKAGIRYGRSAKNSFLHKSLAPETRSYISVYYGYYIIPCTKYPDYDLCHNARYNEFMDAHVHESERHLMLDFTLGKDVGLGTFGGGGTSTIGAGLRIAQFDSQTKSKFNSDPHYYFLPDVSAKYHRVFDVAHQEKRNFHGIGPEITWDASAAIFGNSESGQLMLDWGINAGMLFGRQSATFHTRTRRCESHANNPCYSTHYTVTQTSSRSRSVTVPNLGGYVGASVKYTNAKISFGYRADEFFGAMDGGQATAKKYDRGFLGPYLNLSVGFGG